LESLIYLRQIACFPQLSDETMRRLGSSAAVVLALIMGACVIASFAEKLIEAQTSRLMAEMGGPPDGRQTFRSGETESRSSYKRKTLLV
jgi:hypothetical protein